jgi:4-carboxymuconolactone decarboxylase
MDANEGRVSRGRQLMDEVYGFGFADTLPSVDNPLAQEIVAHLFGEIWSRPELSIRDRRLIVLGATAALGRGDLAEVQVRGAIANDELTEEQLQEIPLHLLFYLGVGNAGVLSGAIARAVADAAPRPPAS